MDAGNFLKVSSAEDPYNEFAAIATATGNTYTYVASPGTLDGLKSDTADLPAYQAYRAIYVGGAGAIAVLDWDGNEAIFAGVPAGTVLPIRPRRLMATGTTATNLIGLR